MILYAASGMQAIDIKETEQKIGIDYFVVVSGSFKPSNDN